MNIIKRPLLRYFGGKWQMRHWIVDHLPPHRFYAEPFAGAASVLLAKAFAPGGEIINDLNGDVVNLFRVVRDRSQRELLQEAVKWTPYAAAELALAQEPVPGDDPVERARRMIVRSFFGIEVAGLKGTASGFRMGNVDLNRLDQDGKRTFRNCATDWMNWKTCLEAIGERLEPVMIYQNDALEFIRQMDNPECLLYVDPPYVHETRSATRYAVEFTAHEQLVARLLACRCMVVLSGYKTELYAPLESTGWERIERESRANMSLTRRTECLWISPNARKKTIKEPDAPFCGCGD